MPLDLAEITNPAHQEILTSLQENSNAGALAINPELTLEENKTALEILFFGYANLPKIPAEYLEDYAEFTDKNQLALPVDLGDGRLAGLHVSQNEDGKFSVTYFDPNAASLNAEDSSLPSHISDIVERKFLVKEDDIEIISCPKSEGQSDVEAISATFGELFRKSEKTTEIADEAESVTSDDSESVSSEASEKTGFFSNIPSLGALLNPRILIGALLLSARGVLGQGVPPRETHAPTTFPTPSPSALPTTSHPSSQPSSQPTWQPTSQPSLRGNSTAINSDHAIIPPLAELAASGIGAGSALTLETAVQMAYACSDGLTSRASLARGFTNAFTQGSCGRRMGTGMAVITAALGVGMAAGAVVNYMTQNDGAKDWRLPSPINFPNDNSNIKHDVLLGAIGATAAMAALAVMSACCCSCKAPDREMDHSVAATPRSPDPTKAPAPVTAMPLDEEKEKKLSETWNGKF